jgi:hypothetical protein
MNRRASARPVPPASSTLPSHAVAGAKHDPLISHHRLEALAAQRAHDPAVGRRHVIRRAEINDVPCLDRQKQRALGLVGEARISSRSLNCLLPREGNDAAGLVSYQNLADKRDDLAAAE